MKRKLLIRSYADGFVQALVLSFLLNFSISNVAKEFSIYAFLIISILLTIILAFVYFLFLVRITSNKTILLFSLNSVSSFVIGLLLFFVIELVLPFEKYYIRETNSADGIMIMLLATVFITGCILLKLGVLVMLITRNKLKTKKDGE